MQLEFEYVISIIFFSFQDKGVLVEGPLKKLTTSQVRFPNRNNNTLLKRKQRPDPLFQPLLPDYMPPPEAYVQYQTSDKHELQTQESQVFTQQSNASVSSLSFIDTIDFSVPPPSLQSQMSQPNVPVPVGMFMNMAQVPPR